jgi:hypothetical protein
MASEVIDNEAEEIVPIPGIPDLAQIFTMKEVGPSRPTSTFTIRELEPGESINDASDGTGPGWNVTLTDAEHVQGSLVLEGSEFRPVAAIDGGLARLGHSDQGVVAAVRGAIVVQDRVSRRIYDAKPGLIHLHAGNRLEILHEIGKRFNDPEHYVVVKDGQPIALKGILTTPHYQIDRIRNFTERTLQFTACALVRNGIILLDGAATPDTFDTPPGLIERLAKEALAGGNHLIAVSKKTTLTVNERDLRSVLDGTSVGPRYLYLNELLERDRQRRVAAGGRHDRRKPIGHLYAVRFGAMGETYRVDVVPATGFTPLEALQSLYASTLFRAGYPDILIRAHLHAYFTYPDLLRLQSAVPKAFGLVPRREIDHGAAFAPFGGRWK